MRRARWLLGRGICADAGAFPSTNPADRLLRGPFSEWPVILPEPEHRYRLLDYRREIEFGSSAASSVVLPPKKLYDGHAQVLQGIRGTISRNISMAGFVPSGVNMNWLWWAPLFAALAHIGEEFVYPGGFAEWDRAYRPHYRESITGRVHLVVNTALIAFCVSVAAGGNGGEFSIGATRLRSFLPPEYAVAGWVALAALLSANAIFHIKGTLAMGRVSPGVRTGVLFYIPLAAFGFWHFISSGAISFAMALIAAAAGGSYEVWASLLHRLGSGRHDVNA